MGFHLAFFLLLASLPVTPSQEVKHTLILVDGTQLDAETDDNFICATIDWWPHDKCDSNHCPWGYSSAVNLDLSHPLLAKAIQGSDKHLEKKILDPRYLDKVASTFGNLSETIKNHGPWSSAWVGENSFIYHLKRTFSWIGIKGSDISFREEYHLTPGGENLRSQTMLLKGIPLDALQLVLGSQISLTFVS